MFSKLPEFIANCKSALKYSQRFFASKSVHLTTSEDTNACHNALNTNDHILYDSSHLELQRSIKQFIVNEINPHVDKWEAECRFPAAPLFRSLGELGVFGVDKQIENGGLGLDFSYNIAVAEVMGEIECGAIPMACAVQSDMATPALCKFGSKYLKEEFLRPTILGERIACLGVSERCAGSDVAGIKTTAKMRSNGDMLINGSKCWITNGHQADWICLLVNTIMPESDAEVNAHKNKSLLCVDMNSPGITLSRPIEKLGMRSSDTAEIFFDDVRVPYKNIIGKPGLGFKYQMNQFQNERLAGVALLLRPLKRVITSTTVYAMERKMFGETAFQRHQIIRYKLAELSAELEALTSLLYLSVIAKVRSNSRPKNELSDVDGASDRVNILAAMTKFKAGRLARKITDECLQIWGGNGYAWDNGISRAFRDFRLFSIGGGCDEVMLSIIAKHLVEQIKT